MYELRERACPRAICLFVGIALYLERRSTFPSPPAGHKQPKGSNANTLARRVLRVLSVSQRSVAAGPYFSGK